MEYFFIVENIWHEQPAFSAIIMNYATRKPGRPNANDAYVNVDRIGEKWRNLYVVDENKRIILGCDIFYLTHANLPTIKQQINEYYRDKNAKFLGPDSELLRVFDIKMSHPRHLFLFHNSIEI